jgi:hypothetical protein
MDAEHDALVGLLQAAGPALSALQKLYIDKAHLSRREARAAGEALTAAIREALSALPD